MQKLGLSITRDKCNQSPALLVMPGNDLSKGDNLFWTRGSRAQYSRIFTAIIAFRLSLMFYSRSHSPAFCLCGMKNVLVNNLSSCLLQFQTREHSSTLRLPTPPQSTASFIYPFQQRLLFINYFSY